MHRDFHDRHAFGALQRLPQQRVRAPRVLLRCQVVGVLEVGGVHLLGGHALQNVDRPVGPDGQRAEVLRVEHDQLPVGGLVALDDVVVIDLPAALAADALVLDPAVVLAVDLVEPVIVVRGGGVDPHTDVHQSERDRAAPHRPHGHVVPG